MLKANQKGVGSDGSDHTLICHGNEIVHKVIEKVYLGTINNFYHLAIMNSCFLSQCIDGKRCNNANPAIELADPNDKPAKDYLFGGIRWSEISKSLVLSTRFTLRAPPRWVEAMWKYFK